MRASQIVARLTELINERGDLAVRMFVPDPEGCPLVESIDTDKWSDEEGWVFCIEGEKDGAP